MNILNIGNTPESNRGLYRIHYINGFLYVGSFVNTGRDHFIGETYFGSSKVALRYGWRKDPQYLNVNFNKSMIDCIEVIYLSEEQKHLQLKLESEWILENAEKYGVARCAKVLSSESSFNYFKDGILLNLHANDCSHLTSKDIRIKAEDTKRSLGVTNKGIRSRLKDIDSFRESSRKGALTRKLLYGTCISDSCREGHLKWLKENPDKDFGLRTIGVHDVGVRTRIRNGSYSTGAAKVALSISGKKHFIEKPIIVEILAESKIIQFKSIIDAEKYFELLGIHITRATISQGLKRTNGNYLYKKLLRFSYVTKFK